MELDYLINLLNQFLPSKFLEYSGIIGIVLLLILQIARFKLVPTEKLPIEGINLTKRIELVLRIILQVLFGLPVYSAPKTVTPAVDDSIRREDVITKEIVEKPKVKRLDKLKKKLL